MRVVADASLRDHEEVLRARYAGDPLFVHPEVGFLRRVLSGRSAFPGPARAFAVRDAGRVVAFAAAFLDPRLRDGSGRPVGSVGFLEALEAAAAVRALDAACEWLAGHGAAEVRAPLNGNPLFGLGLREDAFDRPPLLGCSHHPPEAAGHLEAAGFRRRGSLHSYEVDLGARPWARLPPGPPGVSFRPASRRRFRQELALLANLYNRAFAGVPSAAPVSAREVAETLAGARLLLPPGTFLFAEAARRAVGFALALPDLFEAAAPLRRRPTSPAGLARLALARRRARTAVLLLIGVVPGEQGRGVGTALLARVCRAASARGFTRLEYGLVDEGNSASRATVARLGGGPCRTFGLYARAVG